MSTWNVLSIGENEFLQLLYMQKVTLKGMKRHCSYQLCTSWTEGVLRRLSGSRLISFIMFANLTGNSCRRNINEVFSQAFSDPKTKINMWQHQNKVSTCGRELHKLLLSCVRGLWFCLKVDSGSLVSQCFFHGSRPLIFQNVNSYWNLPALLW